MELIYLKPPWIKNFLGGGGEKKKFLWPSTRKEGSIVHGGKIFIFFSFSYIFFEGIFAENPIKSFLHIKLGVLLQFKKMRAIRLSPKSGLFHNDQEIPFFEQDGLKF